MSDTKQMDRCDYTATVLVDVQGDGGLVDQGDGGEGIARPSAIKGSDVMASSGIITAGHDVTQHGAISLITSSLSEDGLVLADNNEAGYVTDDVASEATHYQSIIYVNHGDGQVTIPADHSILMGPDSQGGALHLGQGDFGLSVHEGPEIDDHNSILHAESGIEDGKIVNIMPNGLALGEQALAVDDGTGLQAVMVKTASGEMIQVVPLQSIDGMSAMKAGGRLVQMLPVGVGGIQTALLVQGEEDPKGETQLIDMASGIQMGDAINSILMPSPMLSKVLPPGTPMWAARIRECEKIGDSYRGWVESEIDLDLLLTYHKQQTHSFWGTRQSPSPAKPSTRLMWKSQYVHFDGVPFINAGSRAIVLECQFGPRRKGAQAKRQLGENYKGEFRKTCPARIYIKKVKKFPEYAVDVSLEKKQMKVAMDKAFMILRNEGINYGGQERYYVQLPTEGAHEFHGDEVIEGPHRLDPRISDRIRECVSKGETRLYVIRRKLRIFVEKELFCSNDGLPEKHNLTFYPTVNDLQNHIHQAIQDIEAGILPLNASHMTVEMLTAANAACGDITDSDATEVSIHHPLSTAVGLAQTESVTVTLTQSPDEDGQHVISKVETHLSDGTTQITENLTPETAKLLSKLHPNLFPSSDTLSVHPQMELPMTNMSSDQNLTSLSSDGDDDPANEVAIATSDPPTHYIVMETPGDELQVCLPDGTTGMIMDQELASSLKTEATDLSISMETEDDHLVKLESESDIMGQYSSPVTILDQNVIATGMEEHIQCTDGMDHGMAHTDGMDHEMTHTDGIDHDLTHSDVIDDDLQHPTGIAAHMQW